MAKKKRGERRAPQRSRYPWHRRLPVPALVAGAALVVAAAFVVNSLGLFGGAGRYVAGAGVGDHRAAPIAYPSYPPTSGAHAGQPTTWGVHAEEVADEAAVHNLEHGGVVASYNGIAPEDVAALGSLVASYPRDQFGEVKVVVRPYAKIAPGSLVLTAWNWVEELPGYDGARVRAFLDSHLGKCCEQVR